MAPDVLAAIDAAREVRIETRAGPDAPVHRTVIWVVVDAGEVYIRSVRGRRGRWYRELMRQPEAVLHTGRSAIPVRATPATDETSVERCSRGLGDKYAGDPSLRSMLRPETLPTTMRLDPR